MEPNELGITPLADRIVLEAEEGKDRTAGGIFLPENAKENPHEGVVLAVGEGRTLDNGTIIAPRVAVGNRVLYARYAGTEIKVNGKKLYIIKEADILAVYNTALVGEHG